MLQLPALAAAHGDAQRLHVQVYACLQMYACLLSLLKESAAAARNVIAGEVEREGEGRWGDARDAGRGAVSL